jgi:hypothetical protein
MYDLKGSTVGRELTEEQKEKQSNGVPVVMKDNEWIANKKTLKLSPMAKEAFLKQLEDDCRVTYYYYYEARF